MHIFIHCYESIQPWSTMINHDLELELSCWAVNNTSSRPSKLKLHTMENSISCNRSEIEQISLIKMCFELCKTLKETGSKFSFALKLDSGFNFSLTSGGVPGSSPKAKTKRHRSGSYLRRQARRRAAFLEINCPFVFLYILCLSTIMCLYRL